MNHRAMKLFTFSPSDYVREAPWYPSEQVLISPFNRVITGHRSYHVAKQMNLRFRMLQFILFLFISTVSSIISYLQIFICWKFLGTTV